MNCMEGTTPDYLHIAIARDGERDVVFHMRAMSSREKRRYRKL